MRGLLALGLGFSLLTGCDRLWQSLLTCADGSSPTSDEAGNPSCSSGDMGTVPPPADGGLLPWPVSPVTIPVSSPDPITGLRVLDTANGVTQSPLNIFYDNKTLYYVAPSSCTGTLVQAVPKQLAAVVLDANSVNLGGNTYSYTITQGAPGNMDIAGRLALATINTMSVAGTTRPGLSYVDKIATGYQLSVARTDGHYLYSSPIVGGVVSLSPFPSLQQTTHFIDQVVHRDFNGDGFPDSLIASLDGRGNGSLAAYTANAGVPGMPFVSSFDGGGDLLAFAEFPGQPRLVRVTRDGSAQVGVSALTPVPGKPLYTLAQAPSPAGWTPGFTPQYLAAISSHNGAAVDIFIAGTRESGGVKTGSVVALQADQKGTLLLSMPVEYPLEGVPTAMTQGGFPCITKAQLIIAQTVAGGAVLRAYEPPLL
jgi:hypothetical protein